MAMTHCLFCHPNGRGLTGMLWQAVAGQVATILGSASETERLGAGYALGRAVGGPAQLVVLLHDDREHVRRAAAYGLSVAGAAAVAPLLELLAGHAP